MNRYQYKDEKGQHLHALDGGPLIGTSSVCKVIAKPLTWWASGLAVKELGWTNAKTTPQEVRMAFAEKMQNEIVGMPPEEYLALLDKAYAAHSKELKSKASDGTDMHADLEAYVKLSIAMNGGTPIEPKDGSSEFIVKFAEWAVGNIDTFLVSEGHCYSERLWTGGITDCIALMKTGNIAIIDFKSSKEAYKSQFVQIGGYDIAQSESGIVDADGNALHEPFKVSEYYVIPFGAPKFEPVRKIGILGDYRKGFESAVTLYKLIEID